MKIDESGIFLLPLVALGARINKLQRQPMYNQVERDDTEERKRKSLRTLMASLSLSLSLSLTVNYEKENENEWFSMSEVLYL